MPVVICHRGGDLFSTPGIPEFNPMMLLHGEENLEIFKPFIPGRKLRVEETMVDFADKKKGAAAIIEAQVKDDETGELYAKVLTTLFIRGLGGFGKKQT
jgi:acyl dehydratase